MAVATAVVCSLWSSPFDSVQYSEGSSNAGPGETWQILRHDGTGSFLVESFRSLGPGRETGRVGIRPEDIVPAWWRDEPLTQDSRRSNRLVAAFGWPCLALRYECAIPYVELATEFDCDCIDTALSPWPDPLGGGGLARRIPYVPVWAGLFINIVFYAAAAWLVVATAWKLRPWIRRRRGQCVRCGYPAGDSIVCTECGSRVAASCPETKPPESPENER